MADTEPPLFSTSVGSGCERKNSAAMFERQLSAQVLLRMHVDLVPVEKVPFASKVTARDQESISLWEPWTTWTRYFEGDHTEHVRQLGDYLRKRTPDVLRHDQLVRSSSLWHPLQHELLRKPDAATSGTSGSTAESMMAYRGSNESYQWPVASPVPSVSLESFFTDLSHSSPPLESARWGATRRDDRDEEDDDATAVLGGWSTPRASSARGVSVWLHDQKYILGKVIYICRGLSQQAHGSTSGASSRLPNLAPSTQQESRFRAAQGSGRRRRMRKGVGPAPT